MANHDKNRQLIYFNSRDRLIRIDLQKTMYFESYGNYSYVTTTDNQKAYLNISLSQVEEVIGKRFGKSGNVFLRIGKRFVVNSSYIYQIDITKQCLMLSDMGQACVRLSVSKNALVLLKKLLVENNV